MSDLFAKVLVDVPFLGALDYKVPEDTDIAVGDRVIVPLMNRKVFGIVSELIAVSDVDRSKVRKISEVLRQVPPMNEEWLNLTKFAASYYLHSWGEAAIPAIPVFFRKTEGVRFSSTLQKMRDSFIKEISDKGVEHYELTSDQEKAVTLLSQKEDFNVNVLFGVTGSGKTEVYMRLIEKTLKKDQSAQVLLLVPEINLTPQLEKRVKTYFPNELVVTTNSNLGDIQRAKSWLATHEGKARILVGTRLAIFSSFKNLRLIIVDEEHDLSYKAQDGLRFSARDIAIWRAKINNCPIVLGSATPSLETWKNVCTHRYSMVEMKNRASQKAQLPEINLTAQPKFFEGEISKASINAVKETLSEGRQVLFFLNRRGYAPSITCPSCGWVMNCEHCSTKMVYHKAEQCLICHHCGDRKSIPEACPVCGNVNILPKGFGTQKIEEEIERLFPERRVLRIDKDNASTKNKSEALFKKIHSSEVDIFIGTQMIAKGHDFKNVGLVVILNTDAQILSPLTRAKERLFATLMQVSGRAGRQGKQGRVLIQTDFPNDVLFTALKAQDYEMYANHLLKEREENYCVPFVYQALLTATSNEVSEALSFLKDASEIGIKLAPETVTIFDPVPMTLLRLMGQERAQLLVEGSDRNELIRFLRKWMVTFKSKSSIKWNLEVDPTEI